MADLKCNLCGGGCHIADQRRLKLRAIGTGVRHPEGPLCESCVEWLEGHGRQAARARALAESIDGVRLASELPTLDGTPPPGQRYSVGE